jgi:hypothetical protein
MFVLLGTLFIAYEGTSALSGLYESNGATDLAFAAEAWAGDVARRIPGTVLLVALVALLAALILRGRLQRGGTQTGKTYPAKRGRGA